MESFNAATTLQVSYKKPLLSSVDHWDDWIEALQSFAEGQGFWSEVNPDNPELPADALVQPRVATSVECQEFISKESTPTNPVTLHDAIQYHLMLYQEQIRKDATTSHVTPRQVAKELKARFAQDSVVSSAATSSRYKDLLQQAHMANVEPKRWIADCPKWEHLGSRIRKDGWKLPAQSAPTSSGSTYPGNLSAATLDPKLWIPTTFTNIKASSGTLRDRLVPGSFVPSDESDYLEAATTSFKISGRGTRVMKNILNGINVEKSEDLALLDVAVVEGFHVNIASESRLKMKDAWYCGFDCTMRFGSNG
ncbi:uncharacterized protein CPUR_01218 [Claviceps purpurea 20.1]|uniref:Uncharacterized protein n=1 Tax=Claviceps purpurea (strain 20.1) TaxID=1111077 RepID=M1WAI3_CLAP2|nr:uncharacterized protein CPUR_01218 [Claviceps purpurea 20.1]